jgi:hypothetical protein
MLAKCIANIHAQQPVLLNGTSIFGTLWKIRETRVFEVTYAICVPDMPGRAIEVRFSISIVELFEGLSVDTIRGKSMSEPLAIYINDHLGGAQVALESLKIMREQHDDPKFREFAERLLPEIQADHEILRSLSERTSSGPSVTKQAGGWLIEKLARLKLGHAGSTNFEMFESLELLVLGIHGKLCLWKALQAASKLDSRLREYNFEELVNRAQLQYDKVESERLKLAQTVLPSTN